MRASTRRLPASWRPSIPRPPTAPGRGSRPASTPSASGPSTTAPATARATGATWRPAGAATRCARIARGGILPVSRRGGTDADERPPAGDPVRTADQQLHVPRRRRRRAVRADRPDRRHGRAVGVRLGLGDGSPLPDRGRGQAHGADARGLLAALGARRPHVARAARHDGHGRHLPQPGAAREDGDDARRDLGGPRDPRHRRRLERRRAQRLRLRVPAAARAVRPARGRRADLPGDVHAGGADLHRHAPSRRRRAQLPPAGAARRAADPDRRQRRAPHHPAGRALRRRVQLLRRRRDDPAQGGRARGRAASGSAATPARSRRRGSARSTSPRRRPRPSARPGGWPRCATSIPTRIRGRSSQATPTRCSSRSTRSSRRGSTAC